MEFNELYGNQTEVRECVSDGMLSRACEDEGHESTLLLLGK